MPTNAITLGYVSFSVVESLMTQGSVGGSFFELRKNFECLLIEVW